MFDFVRDVHVTTSWESRLLAVCEWNYRRAEQKTAFREEEVAVSIALFFVMGGSQEMCKN